MNAKLSPHASGLLNEIIDSIADALSFADALRWNDDILSTILTNEVHVLSIRHSRMLVTDTDTFWN